MHTDPPKSSARPSHASEHALAARRKKREEAEAIGIDVRFIDRFVECFYAKVREDDLLGPIFAKRIEDWPHHLARMKGFWRSILHNSGEFSGNPMRKHMVIPGLEKRHFTRWLELFYATLRELEGDPQAAHMVADRARNIADSLLTGIVTRRDGLAGARAGRNLPYV